MRDNVIAELVNVLAHLIPQVSEVHFHPMILKHHSKSHRNSGIILL
jgi:hypothetical protein